MPDTFRFKREPEWSADHSLVTLCLEDFDMLLKFAEWWLNFQHLKTEEDEDAPKTKPVSVAKLEPKIEDAEFWSMLDQACTKPVNLDKPLFKMEETDRSLLLLQICHMSNVIKSAEGQKLGKSPLDFLSKELSKFTSARGLFSTRQFLPETAVASEFHKACDNVPNVLVIIKSGQYIAGGYTEVPFESKGSEKSHRSFWKSNPNLTTFLFSVNKQKVYRLKHKDKALNCFKERGPKIGYNGLSISNNYRENRCADLIHRPDSSFYTPSNTVGELFGVPHFGVDEYEVYKLE